MYFEMTEINQYHLDRKRELSESMRNAQYEQAELTAVMGNLLKQAGSRLSLWGERLQTTQGQPSLKLVPIVQNQIRRQ